MITEKQEIIYSTDDYSVFKRLNAKQEQIGILEKAKRSDV